jgi:DUF1009 family protein
MPVKTMMYKVIKFYSVQGFEFIMQKYILEVILNVYNNLSKETMNEKKRKKNYYSFTSE